MPLSNTSFHDGDEGVYGPGSNSARGSNSSQGSSSTSAQTTDIWNRGTTADLVQLSFEALLREEHAVAANAASAAMARGSEVERDTYGGWSTWLVGVSQLYTNNPEPALANLNRAREFALSADQPDLAVAAYLGIQLVSAQQHQAELRDHARQLQRQIEKQEVFLTQQFRHMVALAMEALPSLTGRARTPTLTPAAQMQRVAAIDTPSQTLLAPLEIRCFGEFQVFRGGEPVNFKQNRKPADIFKFLLAHRERAVSTDTLLGSLWPDVETTRGMHRLHLNISTLRHILNPPNLDKKHGGYIMTGTNSYYLNPDAIFEVDVDRFTDRVGEAQAMERSGKTEHSLIHLEAAVNLYRDDFLVENVYDEWTAGYRDFLRQSYVDMLGALCKHYLLSKRFEDAISAAKKMLDKDEYREDAHCSIMLALVGLNQRNQALLQYQQCVDILEHDLAVRPTPATTDLYVRIRNNEPVLDLIG